MKTLTRPTAPGTRPTERLKQYIGHGTRRADQGYARNITLAVIATVAAAAVLSSSYTLTKIALRDVPPLTIGFLRFAAAAFILACWVHFHPNYPRPGWRDLCRLSLAGLVGITAYFSVENIGVDFATPTDAALLVAGYPLLTALLELLIFRQRTNRAVLVGFGFAIIGVYLVIGYTAGGGAHRHIGDILLTVSGVIWALYNLMIRDVASRYPMPVILCYQTCAGALGFLPLALTELRQWHSFAEPTLTVGCLCGLTILCSIMGLGLYAYGLRYLRASTSVNLLNLVPLFGLIIPAVTLGERVTLVQLAGGIVIIIGVATSVKYGTEAGINKLPPGRKAGSE